MSASIILSILLCWLIYDTRGYTDNHDEISVMEQQLTDRKALIDTLNAAFLRDKLEDALRRHWSLHLLEVIRPGKNPLELKHDKGHLWRLLLEPVEAFIAGEDQPAEKFVTLKKEDPPTFICNRSIPAGELMFSCRECSGFSAMSLAMCIECFEQSAHKNHRYKKLEGSVTAYCGCDKSKLWTKDFACAQHQPPLDLENANFNLEDARIRVPKDTSKRFTEAIRHALCYVYQVLTLRDGVPIPPDLACPSPSEDPFPFVTILYNDEVDSYDDVIKTLTLALKCTQVDAFQYAILVYDEGRSPVKFGLKGKCETVREEFMEGDSKEQQPLRLDVVQIAAYAHQVFALEVLTWIEGLAEKCEGFRALVCDVCLQFSPVERDRRIVLTFLLEDGRLWKAARRGCHSLFMATFLIFNDAKLEFCRLLVRLYTRLMTEFISDNSDSCTSLTYQFFTVPTVARTLFSDGLVGVILNSFVLFCQNKRNDQGRLSFDKATRPATEAQFQRALYTLVHAGKLSNTVPTSDQWTDALCKGFIGTFEQFLQIMVMMEGMDGHTRSTHSHVEFEGDWKPAFDMQLSMGGTINLFQKWCTSDNKVLSVCIEKLLTAALAPFQVSVKLHAVASERTEKTGKMEKKEVAGCFFDCIEYDVSTQTVSIHHPIIRMLAGLVVPALAKRIVLEVSGGSVPIEEHLKLHARELLELPLRTMVLVAQACRQMWRRNGDVLYHQILYYQDPQWRGEMLDKDIVMMQACATVMLPDSFLVALLDKFALLPWADETFDTTSTSAEDDSVQQVMCLAEEFLYGLIVLVGERFYPGVGRVTEEDCLKNEVIHQLCKENMSRRELLNYLPDQEANSYLDELIKEVGMLQKSHIYLSWRGDIYELKAELTERYNLFFYYYDAIEHSMAKDTQRKQREKTWEEVVFAPPCPPPFSDAFSRIVHLLDCDVFIHLLKLTVRRALINHPRFFFDDQLVRMLYLVGYALHEEKRQRLSNNDNNINNTNNINTNNDDNLKFLEKAADAGIFMALGELRLRSNNETYKNLLEWVLHFYDDLTKQESVDTAETLPVDSAGDVEDDNLEEKKQMKDAQIPCASQDVGDLKEIVLPDDAPSKVAAAPYKLVQKETTSSSDEDLMRLSSASMLQQVIDVDGSSGIAAMAIGVDFGAAKVHVGCWIDGRFERITDKSDEDTIPAFFLRKDEGDVFGQEAREMSTIEPTNVIFDVMQFAGLDREEARDKVEFGMYPFAICSLRGYPEFGFELHDGKKVSPIEIIQCFLKHVHMQCKNLFGLQKFSLAFTVPSYWRKSIRENNETQLLEAARCSGFTRVNLIDSQVAATLGCYLVLKNSNTSLKNILVVDIGATDITATVSRTQLEGETEAEDGTEDETKNNTEDKAMTKTFTVTGIGLGCASVDQALMRYLKNQFVIQHRLPLETVIRNISWHWLRMECEKARVCLSSALTTVLFVPNFAVGYDLHVELTRSTFDDILGSNIAEDVVGIIEEVLVLSKINVELSTKDDLRLFLVGGGSRMPCIRQRMDAEFGTKINSAAVLYCEDAAVIGAAKYARMLELEPNVIKLDIVQYYRNICDFFENHGKPWEGDGAARSAILGLACTHTSTEPTVACLHKMTSIIPSHSISKNTGRVGYCFSIRGWISDWGASFMSISRAQLHHIELTQATAASLHLQQSHMYMLSFEGTLEQEDLTTTGAFDKFEKKWISTIRNPLDLDHRNVVRCLAIGRTVPGIEWRDFFNWPHGEKYMRILLDMRLDSDRYPRSFPSSGLDITLHHFCKERGSALRNEEIINKTKQLLDGLLYLHSREIPLILASLTSSGILVTPDGETVKIWDILFGIQDKSPSELDSEAMSYYDNQNLTYAHPDVSNYILEVDRDYKKCSTLTFQSYMDIWSLGCVVLDMVSRGCHFVCIDNHGIPLSSRMRARDFVRIMVEDGVPLIPRIAPDIIRQLCTMCFERNPDRRTDALALLAMISQIPENEIDVCSIEEASPKQTTVPMFAVSENKSYEFKWISILGRGSYGGVYAVDIPKINAAESNVHNNFPETVDNRWRNGKRLALKILFDCELPESKHRLMRLSHNHVVKYISFGTVSKDTGNLAYKTPKPAILMEYYTGGDLNTLAKQQELSATKILDYAQQIASGLAYLHGGGRTYLQSPLIKPIIHGDLKGENIFLTSETPRTAKIGDIDSSHILKMGKTKKFGERIKQGTVTHMSPEMLAFTFGDEDEEDTDEKYIHEKDTAEEDTEEDSEEDTEKNVNEGDTHRGSTKIGRATDIWSLGCIILEMFSQGEVSYCKKDGSKLAIKSQKQFAKSVSLGAHPDLSVLDAKGIQLDFRQLLQNCLLRKPQKRPRASNLFSALTKLQS